jgi:hypothetical protein
MLAELFVPILAAGAVLVEEMLTGVRWQTWGKVAVMGYLLVVGVSSIPVSLPFVPPDRLPSLIGPYKPLYQPLREFNASKSEYPIFFTGRIGWEELVRGVAGVYRGLPEEDRAVVGIYADGYPVAGAVDLLGPAYGLPHAVSGSLTYYLWGPGYSWDVMIIITGRTNNMSVFFDECEQSAVVSSDYSALGDAYLFVCRKPKVPVASIWSSIKSFR